MIFLFIMILIIVALFFALKFFTIKKQLKSVVSQLNNYDNGIIYVQFADKDLTEIVLKINKIFDKMQQERVQEYKRAAAFKEDITGVAHDMKTPLTSAAGYIQLSKKICSDKEKAQYIDTALERIHYCNELVNNFMEISLIDAGMCNPDFSKIDIAGLLCEQILLNEPELKKKNIVPHFDEADKVIWVYADKRMIERVLQNLISNAIKYANKTIDFGVYESADKVILFIKNETLEKDIDTKHIFDKFYIQNKSQGGNGMGLYICRKFIEAVNGRIEAEFDGDVLNIYIVFFKSV